MKKSGLLVFSILTILSFLFYSKSVIAEEKYGVYDLRKILIECAEGKKDLEVIKKMDSEKTKPIKEKDAELKKLKEDLDKKKSVLTEAAFKEKEMEFQKKARYLEILARDAADDMKLKEKEMLDKLMPKIEKAIKTIGEREKYLVIVDARYPSYFNKSIDLTQKVIEELDKTYKPEK
ncbi:MAG: OmpH family outer membrane protein [Syntrophales bacterium]|jgi:outer membrane protein